MKDADNDFLASFCSCRGRFFVIKKAERKGLRDNV